MYKYSLLRIYCVLGSRAKMGQLAADKAAEVAELSFLSHEKEKRQENRKLRKRGQELQPDVNSHVSTNFDMYNTQ